MESEDPGCCIGCQKEVTIDNKVCYNCGIRFCEGCGYYGDDESPPVCYGCFSAIVQLEREADLGDIPVTPPQPNFDLYDFPENEGSEEGSEEESDEDEGDEGAISDGIYEDDDA